ncbi:MAG TPA: VOC family protein [Candidatus Paceibacterota bacterium]|nr:VOC family protein [Candidatus Paceibacterota bacterium]
MQKITPCLWFDTQAEEAANFYASIFKNSKVKNVTRYDEASAAVSGQPAGSALTVAFELEGQEFIGLNGGPVFTFSEAVSFSIDCKDQEEVDYFWEKLSEGGSESQCGWLKDKFGLSWQVVPSVLPKLLGDTDAVKAKRVVEAMLKMKKIVVKDLEDAYNQN